MTGGGRPTSRDVAAAAGVSQSTVSMVLAGKWAGRVSPATADRVREAAGRLGYRPNVAARRLRLGEARTVLLVVPTLSSPFFGAVYEGAARVAAEHGVSVVVYLWPERGAGGHPFAHVPEAIDGVLAASIPSGELSELDVPAVTLDMDPTAVTFDVAGGFRLLVEHLAALGHLRFGHLAADVDAWTFRTRHAAISAAVTAAGGTVTRTRTAIAVPAARTAARHLLTTGRAPDGPERVTALVCDDDIIAAGAYKAARDLGLSVPGDLSVTGFDDVLLAEALEPELTTVRLPAQELGARGMAALLTRLDGGSPDAVALPGRLMVRASTAPPPRPASRTEEGAGGA